MEKSLCKEKERRDWRVDRRDGKLKRMGGKQWTDMLFTIKIL